MEHTSTILIIDDEPAGRATLEMVLLPQNYQLEFAASGAEALAKAAKLTPDLILLDVMLPEMDGFEVCRRLRADPCLREVPVIMVTTLDDRASRVQGIEAGADDFISKPFDRTELCARVRTITRLNRYRHLQLARAQFARVVELAPVGIAIVDLQRTIRLANPALLRMLGIEPGHQMADLHSLVAPEHVDHYFVCLERVFANRLPVTHLETVLVRMDGRRFPVELDLGQFEWDDRPAVQIIVRDISERKQTETQIQMLLESLQFSNNELVLAYEITLEGWSRALDLRDKETEGHTQRVTDMSVRLARAMGLSEEELIHIRRGALLHDIGKMGIPDSILLKPGPLTEEEWVIMRKHPGYAYDLLAPITFLHPALAIPYCHHEKWDGSGYPRGLKGTEIPQAARIFAVVDVWDALCSDRPYRPRWPEGRVYEHIRALAGSHFDPQVVDAFLALDRHTI